MKDDQLKTGSAAVQSDPGGGPVNCVNQKWLDHTLGGPWFWNAQGVALAAAYAFASSDAGWDYFARRGRRRTRPSA